MSREKFENIVFIMLIIVVDMYQYSDEGAAGVYHLQCFHTFLADK